MKVLKSEIRLSDQHPSLLVTLEQKPVLAAPVVLNQDGILMDGYRRYQIQPGEELEAVCIPAQDVFEAAYSLNERTRNWDETECFLWTRWARSLQKTETGLPITRFGEELFQAPPSTLSLLADRRLLLRQSKLILDAPARYRTFFEKILSSEFQLNVNETADFIEMACDLVQILKKDGMEDLFDSQPLKEWRQSGESNLRKKGEAVLKAMRALRYPYYQEKSERFSTRWKQLNMAPDIDVDRGMFLERGVLKISFSSLSFEDLKRKIESLHRSLRSSVWDEIWKE